MRARRAVERRIVAAHGQRDRRAAARIEEVRVRAGIEERRRDRTAEQRARQVARGRRGELRHARRQRVVRLGVDPERQRARRAAARRRVHCDDHAVVVGRKARHRVGDLLRERHRRDLAARVAVRARVVVAVERRRRAVRAAVVRRGPDPENAVRAEIGRGVRRRVAVRARARHAGGAQIADDLDRQRTRLLAGDPHVGGAHGAPRVARHELAALGERAAAHARHGQAAEHARRGGVDDPQPVRRGVDEHVADRLARGRAGRADRHADGRHVDDGRDARADGDRRLVRRERRAARAAGAAGAAVRAAARGRVASAGAGVYRCVRAAVAAAAARGDERGRGCGETQRAEPASQSVLEAQDLSPPGAITGCRWWRSRPAAPAAAMPDRNTSPCGRPCGRRARPCRSRRARAARARRATPSRPPRIAENRRRADRTDSARRGLATTARTRYPPSTRIRARPCPSRASFRAPYSRRRPSTRRPPHGCFAVSSAPSRRYPRRAGSSARRRGLRGPARRATRT
ncbi:hypothetical protein BURPS1710b_0067 [Burkholderia pseudomallei 1710b]|uniref:Uncharacterized protein n=1 Tax=Burkholderia pseudomallei (strain 1710b) TaxID=320372 RepID=Q3JY69_BURP1|nr:hypothetical protein BURPS1710b_0067 [Burkholderia pseudomallei 1710b]